MLRKIQTSSGAKDLAPNLANVIQEIKLSVPLISLSTSPQLLGFHVLLCIVQY